MPEAPDFQRALGAAVRAGREELGLTQEQVRLDSGIHRCYLSNVETGKRNVSYASLRKLAASLDLKASELIIRAEALETAR